MAVPLSAALSSRGSKPRAFAAMLGNLVLVVSVALTILSLSGILAISNYVRIFFRSDRNCTRTPFRARRSKRLMASVTSQTVNSPNLTEIEFL